MNLILSGIAISVFLTALILFKKNKRKADYILLSWFLLITASQILSYIDSIGGQRSRYGFLIGINIPFALMHAPLLFLYVSALTNSFPKKYFALLHFIPALCCYIYLIPFYILPAPTKIKIMDNNGLGYELFQAGKFIAIIISGIIYLAGCHYKIRRHQKSIANIFSETKQIDLQWLNFVTYSISILWIFVFFGSDLHITVAVACFMAAIGFFGIRHTTVFTKDWNISVQYALSEADAKVTSGTLKKYENSGLSEQRKEEIKKDLKKLVDIDKIYLNPELSVNDVAAALEMHPNYVSQYINEDLGLTFYDYINSKRIDEFKRIVQIPGNSKFNILGLSYDCGFNSKSTFNRNFKKFTGITPTEYVKSLQ